eukprot:15483627-Alexandrium_andersonii.AAC.1
MQTVRAQEHGLKCPPCKASSGRFGVILRAGSDGGDETGRWARRKRFSRRSGGQSRPEEYFEG